MESYNFFLFLRRVINFYPVLPPLFSLPFLLWFCGEVNIKVLFFCNIKINSQYLH